MPSLGFFSGSLFFLFFPPSSFFMHMCQDEIVQQTGVIFPPFITLYTLHLHPAPSESPTESPSEPPSVACKKEVKLIARFLTKPAPSNQMEIPTDPLESQIIEGVIGAIYSTADLSLCIENLENVYSEKVEVNCGEPGYCRILTETTICLLDSADPAVVNGVGIIMNNEKKILRFLSEYFKDRFNLILGYTPYIPSSVDIVEY